MYAGTKGSNCNFYSQQQNGNNLIYLQHREPLELWEAEIIEYMILRDERNQIHSKDNIYMYLSPVTNL